MKKKYIITGAPGTGKSTLIETLEKKGVACMKEVSREVIIKEQQDGKNGMPWKDIQRFTELVYAKTVEKMMNDNALICDRSLIDLEAYLSIENQSIPKYLSDYPYHEQYETIVFFAPTWFDIYCKDGQRIQEFDYCTKLEKVLIDKYQSKGFDLVKLPLVSPSERTEYLLKFILSYTN